MASIGGIRGDAAILNTNSRTPHLNPFQTVLQKSRMDAAARQKAKQDSIIDQTDFVITDKSLKKPFANDMMKVNMEMLQKMNEYQNDGKGNAKNRFLADYTSNFLPRIQSLKAGNTEALRYEDLVQNGKIRGYESVLEKINTGDSTSELNEEVQRLGDNKLMSDDIGNFSFIGVSPYDYSKFNKLEDNDYLPEKIGTPRPIGLGQAEISVTRDLNPQVFQAKKQSLLSDASFINNVYHDAPLEIRKDPESFRQYLGDEVDALAAGLQQQVKRSYTQAIPRAATNVNIGFNKNGTGSNERFTVTEITPGVVQDATLVEKGLEKGNVAAQLRVNKGYALKDLTASENAPQYWSAENAFDVGSGKLVKGFKKKGSLVAVNEESQLEDRKGNVLHKFENPMAVIKVEEGEGSNKKTKVYTIPYNSVKGEIKGYTADKKGLNGWELPRGQAPEKSSEIELTGKINPANLKVGQKYRVGNTTYTWTGTNLE